MSYIDRLKVNNVEYDIHDNRFEEGTQYSDGSKVLGNDYEKDGVLYPATAGMKAFCWSAVSSSGLRYTFTITDGTSQAHPTVSVPAGALVSVKADYSWSFAGTLVNAITTSSTQVVVDIIKTPPTKWTPNSSICINNQDEGYLWFPEYPEAGVVEKGDGAITFGVGCRANEEGATAAGRITIADGRYSFTVGRENQAAYASLVGGYNNKAYGIQSAVFGLTNNTTGSNLLTAGEHNTVDAAGCSVTGRYNQLDADSSYTTVGGQYNTLTRASNSLVVGNGNTVTDAYHAVTGRSNTVSGWYNTVFGQGNTVTSSGERSVVIGNYGTVTSTYSLLLSRLTSNPSDWSSSTTYSQGVACKYNGVIYSSTHTNNTGNTPPDISSTTASDYEHWMPVARVGGTGSASFGLSGVTGKYGLATGNTNLIKGDYGFASGIGNLVLSASSSAAGVGLIANGTTQNVRGRYNVTLGNDYAEIVGRGTAYNNRKNISVLTTSGDLHIAGDIYVGANNDGTGGTKLVNTLEQKNTVSSNDDYRVLLTYTANDTDVSEIARKSSKLKFNPSSGILNVATSVQVNGNTSYKDNSIEFDQGVATISYDPITPQVSIYSDGDVEIDADGQVSLPTGTLNVSENYIIIGNKRLYLSDTAPTGNIPAGSIGLGW